MTQVAIFLVIAAASWFMLKELAVLLRPLLMAALICYLVLPMHSRLQKQHSEPKTIAIMTAGGLLITGGLGLIVYGSIISMSDELPRLTIRAHDVAKGSKDWSNLHLPAWMNHAADDFFRAEAKGVQMAQNLGSSVLQYAANILIETAVVSLYVIFLMLEAGRMRRRVRNGFDADKSRHILDTVRTINDGIANYLKAKVRTSLILAVPVTVILVVFGVKFAPIFGLVTFLANFVPYVGTLVGLGAPLAFIFLDLPLSWQPVVAILLIATCHLATAAFVEPTMIGNAVGLSPLVVLISLTFWGLCWGIVGMFLAVPLTVTMKIVFANIESTKPIAALLGDT